MFLDTREHPPRKRKGTFAACPAGSRVQTPPEAPKQPRIDRLTFPVHLDIQSLHHESLGLTFMRVREGPLLHRETHLHTHFLSSRSMPSGILTGTYQQSCSPLFVGPADLIIVLRPQAFSRRLPWHSQAGERIALARGGDAKVIRNYFPDLPSV